MIESPIVSRVIVVVLDGLRADVVSLLQLPTFERLARIGTASLHAHTVRPSVTAAAMGSLFTGVCPAEHGLSSDCFCVPRPTVTLEPLPLMLRNAGIATHVFLSRIPFMYRGIARRLARMAGVDNACFRGDDALSIVRGARAALQPACPGLFFFHLPDADRAGHKYGWTSRAYMAATCRLDAALGEIDALSEASSDPETLLIALADHGGGGIDFHDHESDHPHDVTIPLVLGGGRVSRGELAPFSSLLDVPPTVLWALGVKVPERWSGRPLMEAFAGVSCLVEARESCIVATR